MRKQLFIAMTLFGLISCTNNLNSVTGGSKVTLSTPSANNFRTPSPQVSTLDKCIETNFSGTKIDKINVPNAVGYTPNPEISGLKIIEKTFSVQPKVSSIKGNKFISAYMFISGFVGKIFDESGNEVVPRFKIADITYNKLLNYKIISDKSLDYFLIIYSSKDNETLNSNNIFIKKFDLEGNQIGNEIKLQSDISMDSSDINYSFDGNKKEIIISWVNLEFAYKENKCMDGEVCVASVSPSYYYPILNYIKLDEKLNYCLKKIKFDEIVKSYYKNYPVIYITKNHKKIIFQSDLNMVKEVDLSNNSINKISFPIKNEEKMYPNLYSNFIAEDDKGLYYIRKSNSSSGNNLIYKTNNNQIINSEVIKNGIKTFSESNINIINDKLKISPDLFIDPNNLDLYGFKSDVIVENSQYMPNPELIKLDSKFLYTLGNYFKVF